MAKFLDYVSPYGKKNPLYHTNQAMKKFWLGSPEEHERVSTLREEQEPLYQQLVNSGMNPGAGGAFGTAADYYRNLLSDNPADLAAYSAPMMRQYNEEIVPGLSEQFAGMGAGGLSSSGFRNAQVQGATDLSERLGAIRAQLRQQGAQGLTGIGQMGLGNFSQDVMTKQGSPGFLSQAGPAVLTGAATLLGGPAAGAATYGLTNQWGGNKTAQNTSPYGPGGPQASPRLY